MTDRMRLTLRSMVGGRLPPLVAAACCIAGCGGQKARIGPSVPYADADNMALRVDCQPGEAQVRVDGVYQGDCELLSKPGVVLRLAAGTHQVEVAAEGHRPFRSMVSARGMRQHLTVRLQPRPAP